MHAVRHAGHEDVDANLLIHPDGHGGWIVQQHPGRLLGRFTAREAAIRFAHRRQRTSPVSLIAVADALPANDATSLPPAPIDAVR
jgi:hypothetical protein